ncbi:hypothetical protein [Flagellimonas sp.]|uniref:hypothetical protein n=1 Tax=Flagellimonas sp. TaxID=2058762 RepID=UPI003BACD380
METSKAIRLIKDYVTHYMLMDNLWSIGLRTDNWLLNKSGLCEIIFDIKPNGYDSDEILESFCKHADKLNKSITNSYETLPDDKITSTAIDIYSDWKALIQKQPIKA